MPRPKPLKSEHCVFIPFDAGSDSGGGQDFFLFTLVILFSLHRSPNLQSSQWHSFVDFTDSLMTARNRSTMQAMYRAFIVVSCRLFTTLSDVLPGRSAMPNHPGRSEPAGRKKARCQISTR